VQPALFEVSRRHRQRGSVTQVTDWSVVLAYLVFLHQREQHPAKHRTKR
jgi:hypothetical protein